MVIARSGNVVSVIVGDEREVVIPLLDDYPLGRRSLRGVRLVHTHLKNEALSTDDLTDLALLRLDYIAAIGVGTGGEPLDIHLAHLVPVGPEAKDFEVEPPLPFQRLHARMDDFGEFVSALEDEMGRAAGVEVGDKRERAILVSVSLEPKYLQEGSLVELRELARTSDIKVIETFLQRPAKINPKYLVGTGKIKEIIIKALQKNATMLVFDSELSPTQVREIGKITELKVLDRTQLILDIFARRAHTRDGKVQVELAQLKYLLPKLSGKGTAMSRLMGGIGARGPGESKLEIDRRRVGERISRLEKELKNLSRGRKERRRQRARSNVPIISIVGYTNAGKSTLMNALTNSETLAEDKLFATLDTTTRRLRFPKERDVVITDTVGFISRLPKELMKAFRATLEEMEDADLLLHLIDSSSERLERDIDTVEKILTEIGLDHIPRLMVFNKADLAPGNIAENLSERHKGVAVSAIDKKTLPPLLKRLEEELWGVVDTSHIAADD